MLYLILGLACIALVVLLYSFNKKDSSQKPVEAPTVTTPIVEVVEKKTVAKKSTSRPKSAKKKVSK